MTLRPIRALPASLALLALLAPFANAQQQRDPRAVQPERPTVATHAGTVTRGWLEIEAGLEIDRLAPGTRSFLSPEVLKFGVAERVQLSLFIPIVRPPGQSTTLGDFAAGVKWRVTEAAPLVGDLAVLPIVKFATGSVSTGAGTGTTDLSFLVISSHALGAVAMDLNAGYTRRSGDGSVAPRDASVWTASFGGPFIGRVGWVAELYGYPGTGGPDGQRPIVALLAGPTLVARSWWSLDIGVIVPVSGPQARAVYAGTVYNVGRYWPAPRQ